MVDLILGIYVARIAAAARCATTRARDDIVVKVNRFNGVKQGAAAVDAVHSGQLASELGSCRRVGAVRTVCDQR